MKNIFKLLVLVALIAFAVWAKKAGLFEKLLETVEGLGVWAAPAFVGIFIFSCLFLFPTVIMTCAAGILFPLPLAILLSLIGTALGSVSALLIGRYGLRSWMLNSAAKNPKFRQLDEAISREGWKIAVMARLTPVFPFSIGNYLFGATQIPAWVYAATAFVGTIPSASVYSLVGRMTGNLSSSGAREKNPLEWVLLAVGIAATIFLSIYLKKFFDRIFSAGKIKNAG